LGGDEFAVVRTGLQHPKEAEAFAQQLREIVAGHTYDLKGHQTGSDLSVGIALAPEDGLEIDELLNHADLALYGAKAEGRGSYRYYEPEMNARMKRRRSLEVDLRAALLKNEFVLYYQPILDLETEVIAGSEALLRWRHPQRGMVLPAEFIPVAEETGLISSIGEWVLKQACSDATAWPSSVRVAVNVSPAQFRNSALPLAVVGALAESGLPAQRLELEITESVLMQNNESSLLTLHQLRELGVRIALDDFGTGYSSLSYLRSFPFDRIKIDRSFVADLLDGNEAVAIVHAILSLASSLKMQTTMRRGSKRPCSKGSCRPPDATRCRVICSVNRCRQAVSASSFGCGSPQLPTSHSLSAASAAEGALKILRATQCVLNTL
jgi:predicted signal transduction protein with EAL and GGDEF domain